MYYQGIEHKMGMEYGWRGEGPLLVEYCAGNKTMYCAAVWSLQRKTGN